MPDLEKVIKWLGIHADRSDKTDCDDCPYSKDDFSKRNCISQLCSDALALLKEQGNMISIKAVSDFLAEYALPPTLQKQNLFSFNGNMASEWERFLRDLKGR